MTLSLYGQGKDFGKEASTSVSIYPGRWANLEYRSGPKLSIEVGQTGLSKPPWIEVWYNRKRRHSTLGYLSPEAFERKHQQEQAEAIAAQAASLSEASRDASGASYAAAAQICHPR